MDGNTITFPNGQFLGDDGYGEEYLVGSNDIQHAVAAYCYWENAVFTKEGAATAIDHTTASTKSVKRVVDGQLVILRDGKVFNVLGAEIQ